MNSKPPLRRGVIWVSLIAFLWLASSAEARIPPRKTSLLASPGKVLNLRGGASTRSKRTSTLIVPVEGKVIGELTQQRKTLLALCAVAASAAAVYASDMSAGNRIINSVASALTTTRAKLLVLMVFQNACTVLLGRYTRSSPKSTDDLYVINHLVLMCEAVKFVLSALLEYRATDGQLLESIEENVLRHPMNSVKIILPSLLYLVQNSLQYVALSNLSAPLFQVTYQTKLLTTALASVLMLQRRYTPKQWVCLVTLGIGVAIVVLGESAAPKSNKRSSKKVATEGKHEQHLVVGLSAVTVACLSSALASVYLEKVLKKPAATDTAKPVSLWMFNLQMAFFSACIAGVQTRNLTGEDAKKPFLHGFTPFVWMLVLLQAGGGLLVAAVMKYADNVLKGLATGVSVVVSTSLSMVLFGTPVTKQFSVGACIILASVYYFSHS